ncbi:MAG: hypothetical protein J1G38_04410 [Clostridiales bacterium]|nr:hypothetical protein [Clostridiales bacterium]
MSKVDEPTLLFSKSKWIWAADATHRGACVVMRKTLSFGTERPPARALCRAACETHYYLYVNGHAAVWHGGLSRGKQAYYDEFDIAKFLMKGDNVIVVYCQYYGNDGRDLVTAPRAGFIFECNDLNIYSDESFLVYDNVAYKQTKPVNCCYAGNNMMYDASLEGQIQNVLMPSFNSSLFQPATVLSEYPDELSGTLLPRPLPLDRFSAQPVIGRVKKSTDQFAGDTYTIELPREMRVTPYMEVTGNGQERIRIYTDKSACRGTFGDEASVYNAYTIEYLTKPTVNIFEGLLPMTGEKLIFSMPRTVKVMKLGYREIGYDAEPTCVFQTDNARVNALFGKAMNTLYACMGSTIVDTPERERTLWLGDGSIAARALYLGFNGAAPLVKKAIDDILDYRDGEVLNSCVPGNLPVDMPAHGLLALGEYGIFAQYRNFVGDLELLRREHESLCDYLMMWEMTEHGVALRDGSRRWYDNLYNVDEPLIENALYYSACKYMVELGNTLGGIDYLETLEDRMDNIADYIESCWDGLGYISREDGYDDRANALIALSGLVPDDRKADVARLLCSTHSASPYLEWAVIEALGALGRKDLALKRFESRYALLADSESSTLGEDFNGYGSSCQSYQSAVISELVTVFGGIDIKKGATHITITPDFTALKDLRCSLKLATGELDVRYKYSSTRIDIVVENHTTAKVALEIIPELIGRGNERKKITINKGKNKFTI